MIRILRTIANQIIIGDTFIDNKTVSIKEPYDVIPTPNGIQLFPLDQDIIGVPLKETRIYKTNLLYITEPGVELTQAYENALNPLVEPQEKLILE